MNIPSNVERAAGLLRALDVPLMYVGGAVAPLYFQRSEYAGEERPTIDVDCVVEVASYVSLQGVLETMRNIGFSEGREPADPICRWRGHGLVLDLVPLDANVLGFSNRWYAAGWDAVETIHVAEGNILILPYGFYLATKLEAFTQRGLDPRMSHDLEDVFLTLAARLNLEADREALIPPVASFLRDVFRPLFRGRYADELIGAYLPAVGDGDAELRIRRFVNRLTQ